MVSKKKKSVKKRKKENILIYGWVRAKNNRVRRLFLLCVRTTMVQIISLWNLFPLESFIISALLKKRFILWWQSTKSILYSSSIFTLYTLFCAAIHKIQLFDARALRVPVKALFLNLIYNVYTKVQKWLQIIVVVNGKNLLWWL